MRVSGCFVCFGSNAGSSAGSSASGVIVPVAKDEREDDDAVTCSPRSAASSASASASASGTGAKRLDLAPLRTLTRVHPYRRDKFDDKALMAFSAGRRNSD